jgi:hypothetical protein
VLFFSVSSRHRGCPILCGERAVVFALGAKGRSSETVLGILIISATMADHTQSVIISQLAMKFLQRRP